MTTKTVLSLKEKNIINPTPSNTIQHHPTPSHKVDNLFYSILREKNSSKECISAFTFPLPKYTWGEMV
jgi:hypothetical protein